MNSVARCGTTALAVAVLLWVTTSVSWASRLLGLEPMGRTITFTSERLTFEGGGATVVCPVTLSGTFASGLETVEGVLPGEISRVNLPERSCTGGTVRLLTETLPWWVKYYSFAGTLPRITSLALGLEELSALAEIFGVGCLARGTPRGTTSSGSEVREVRLDETVAIPIVTRLSAFCPSQVRLRGTFRVSPTVRITLNEAIPGSTIEATPNPVAIPPEHMTGTTTLSPVGNWVRVIRTIPDIDPNEPPFHASSACENKRILLNDTCIATVTAVAGSRPTSGDVEIFYLNSEQRARVHTVSVEIE